MIIITEILFGSFIADQEKQRIEARGVLWLVFWSYFTLSRLKRKCFRHDYNELNSNGGCDNRERKDANRKS